MRRRLLIATGVCLGIVLGLSGARPVQAQEAKSKSAAAKPKQDRIDGTVKGIDKKTKTIMVQVRGQNLRRDVIYDDKTKFTYRNKPASLEDVKDGRRVIVLGKLTDKGQMNATRVDVRDTM